MPWLGSTCHCSGTCMACHSSCAWGKQGMPEWSGSVLLQWVCFKSTPSVQCDIRQGDCLHACSTCSASAQDACLVKAWHEQDGSSAWCAGMQACRHGWSNAMHCLTPAHLRIMHGFVVLLWPSSYNEMAPSGAGARGSPRPSCPSFIISRHVASGSSTRLAKDAGKACMAATHCHYLAWTGL